MMSSAWVSSVVDAFLRFAVDSAILTKRRDDDAVGERQPRSASGRKR
jgi:hypothetical protein